MYQPLPEGRHPSSLHSGPELTTPADPFRKESSGVSGEPQQLSQGLRAAQVLPLEVELREEELQVAHKILEMADRLREMPLPR